MFRNVSDLRTSAPHLFVGTCWPGFLPLRISTSAPLEPLQIQNHLKCGTDGRYYRHAAGEAAGAGAAGSGLGGKAGRGLPPRKAECARRRASRATRGGSDAGATVSAAPLQRRGGSGLQMRIMSEIQISKAKQACITVGPKRISDQKSDMKGTIAKFVRIIQ